MKKKLSKLSFLVEADLIFKKSTLKFIGVVFTDDGEYVKWFNNYDSRSAAAFNAQHNGSNSWTHDQINGLQPA